jgi:hypothetical protein
LPAIHALMKLTRVRTARPIETRAKVPKRQEAAITLIGEFRCGVQLRENRAYFGRPQSPKEQEQTQIIATAIGRPTTKAPTIMSENSESKFVPGRAFSTNMPISPPLTSN